MTQIRIVTTRAPGLLPSLIKEIDHTSNPVVLVPESFTLACETEIVNRSRDMGIFGLKIFSPSSLVREIRELTGHGGKKPVSADGQNMIIAQVLHHHQDELKYYRDSVAQPTLAQKIASQINDFARARLSPGFLLEFDPASRRTKAKLEDMALVWGSYPQRSEYFSNLSIPSYMRDWLVMKFSDDEGVIDYESVRRYIKRYIPSREDFEQYKFQMVNGESVQFLARTRVSVDVKSGKTVFELPDFGGARGGASGVVAYDVVDKWQEALLHESENWGIITLSWTMEGTVAKPKGVITMVGYKPFCPYSVDLEFFRDARKEFNIHEWIDVIISAVDYNPEGYLDDEGNVSEAKKLFFLRRLLPFVEKRVNLIELAPKGTGKSYVFEKISKRGWLISGGTVSRASLIYDNARKTGGLLTRFDYVGFDEVQSITFEQPGQIQQALKHYMEFGEIKGFDAMLTADAGVIVLGNINAERFDINKNMVEHISEVFGESATLDRFHGFIPGWEIPRLTTGLIAKGWAINTEYYAEVLHAMRDDLSYAGVVDELLVINSKADKRHITAIKRLCTALLKLLFPHVQSPSDIDREDFIEYCLNPALEMRGVIYKQLCIIDPKEYAVASKAIPEVSCK